MHRWQARVLHPQQRRGRGSGSHCPHKSGPGRLSLQGLPRRPRSAATTNMAFRRMALTQPGCAYDVTTRRTPLTTHAAQAVDMSVDDACCAVKARICTQSPTSKYVAGPSASHRSPQNANVVVSPNHCTTDPPLFTSWVWHVAGLRDTRYSKVYSIIDIASMDSMMHNHNTVNPPCHRSSILCKRHSALNL